MRRGRGKSGRPFGRIPNGLLRFNCMHSLRRIYSRDSVARLASIRPFASEVSAMILPIVLLLAIQPATVGSVPRVVVGPSQTPPSIVNELRRAVRPPQGRLAVQSLFSPDDYPAGADGRRGTVGLRLIVAPQGGVVFCSITQSSGSAALDSATCNTIRRRERYTPALDKDGKPTLGAIEEAVDWERVFRNAPARRGN